MALARQANPQPKKGAKRSRNQISLVGAALISSRHSYFNTKSTFAPVRENLQKTLKRFFLLSLTFVVLLSITSSHSLMRQTLTKASTSWKNGQPSFRNSQTFLDCTHLKMITRMLLSRFLFPIITRPSTISFNLLNFRITFDRITDYSRR